MSQELPTTSDIPPSEDVRERISFLEEQLASLLKEVARNRATDILTNAQTNSVSTMNTSFTSSEIFQVGESKNNEEKVREADLEVNMNERQPRSFRINNSFITARINADDDFKVCYQVKHLFLFPLVSVRLTFFDTYT